MKLRRALPPRVSWPWLAAAVGVWVVTSITTAPLPPLSPSTFGGEVTLLTDVFDGRFGGWALGEIKAGIVLVEVEPPGGRGDVLRAEGVIRGDPGTAAGRRYRAVLVVDSVLEHQRSRFLPHVAGLAIRHRVMARLKPVDSGRALLAGFLIGDTSGIADADRDAMRRSGLSHFVAVSGSNVALFLGILAVCAGPLALGPRRRAVIGLIGLPVYAAATRFEPSVMRATVMAAIALGGRLAGLVLEAWQLLSLAVVVLLLTDSSLVSNVGFQLSVAATGGVLVGSRWPATGRIGRALAVTAWAQLAVAPLLIVNFGKVPLLSPLVNLLAAPLVTAATILGALGVVAIDPAVSVATWFADLVLALARGAAGWPQLAGWQFAVLLALGSLVIVKPALRPTAATLGALSFVLVLTSSGTTLTPGSVAVLDVGQGDAILLHGGSGHYALIDGGPDPATLIDRLRTYRVSQLDLVIVTHVHADHVAGLNGIVGQIPMGQIWAHPQPHETPAYSEFVSALGRVGQSTVNPSVGQTFTLGDLKLEVGGPKRRYASANDQSIVIIASGPERSMLLSGDIETFAQRDLDDLRADVLKVPHHGAATSDRGWLGSTGATDAIISVGSNDFGHPADWVIEVLEQSGARVRRTDQTGDVVVDLASRGEGEQ